MSKLLENKLISSKHILPGDVFLTSHYFELGNFVIERGTLCVVISRLEENDLINSSVYLCKISLGIMLFFSEKHIDLLCENDMLN